MRCKQLELVFQPVDVAFFVYGNCREEIARADIACFVRIIRGLGVEGAGLVFVLEIDLEHFLERLGLGDLLVARQVRRAIQEHHAADELIGVPQLLLHLFSHLGGELIHAPVRKHMGVQQILTYGRKFHLQPGLQMREDFLVAFHGRYSF